MVHGLSCSAACWVPRPGFKPMSPALAGGFFTTEPSGKPEVGVFKITFIDISETISLWGRILGLIHYKG